MSRREIRLSEKELDVVEREIDKFLRPHVDARSVSKSDANRLLDEVLSTVRSGARNVCGGAADGRMRRARRFARRWRRTG
jgi:hypothetical protein